MSNVRDSKVDKTTYFKLYEQLEESEWDKFKGLAMNQKSVVLAQIAVVGTALYQVYKSTSRSTADIVETFDAIKKGLQPSTHALLHQFCESLAKQTDAGVDAAFECMSKIIQQLTVTLDPKLLNQTGIAIGNCTDVDPELLKKVDGMQKYILDTTDNYNNVRGVALGGVAAIVGAFLLIDYLQQFKKSLDPHNKLHFAVGGGLSLLMLLGLFLRGAKCFSSASEHAPAAYTCSAAQDSTARGFNNFLIEIAYLAGADVLLRFVNSSFVHGAGQTITNIGEALSNAPSAARAKVSDYITEIRIWARPGDTVKVTRATKEGQLAKDEEYEVEDPSQSASAPLLSSTS